MCGRPYLRGETNHRRCGEEDESYLDNPSNASIIYLEKVLVFEPLLESVFGGTGSSYEFSERENKFLELNE